MRHVTYPLYLGLYGEEVRNLQDVISFIIDKNLVVLPNTTPFTEFYMERQQSFYGNATGEVIKAYRTVRGMQPTTNPNVDAVIANDMNSFLDGNITIRGFVRHSTGMPLPSPYPVSVFQVLFDTTELLGSATTDDSGSYSISISKAVLTTVSSKYALKSVVEVQIGEEYESANVYVSEIDFARPIQIDVTLNNPITVTSEYEALKTRVEAVIGSTDIADISIDNTGNLTVDYIAQVTGESQANITRLIYAFRLKEELNNLSPELFYGMLKQGLPVTSGQLLYQPTPLMKKAVLISVADLTISNHAEGQVDTFLNALKPEIVNVVYNQNQSSVPNSATYRICNKVLNNATLTKQFLSIFFDYQPDDANPVFWDYLVNKNSAFAAHLPALKAVMTVSPIAGSNPALVGSMLSILNGGTYSGSKTLPVVAGQPDPRLLSTLTESDWLNVVTAAKANDNNNFFYPPVVSGQSDSQKNADYANRLYHDFTLAFPTHAINARLTADTTPPLPKMKASLNAFLSDNIDFDFRSASILQLEDSGSGFDFSAVPSADKDAFIQEIGAVQRLLLLTTDYTVMKALLSDGLVSSMHIASMTSEAFVAEYSSILGGDSKALTMYETATSVTSYVTMSTMEIFTEMTSDKVGGGTGVWTAYPAPPVGSVDPQPVPDPFAEWRTLFGSLDSCVCCHCESLYSPSAYLVDTLRFLKSNVAAHDALINGRRPDIKNIELTCDNSDIPLPYIDIVNELLEDVASRSSLPESSGSRPGYYQMFARQTTVDAAHQRAIPEHINTSGVTIGAVTIASPYPMLKDTKYPWTLPYNFFKRQIDVHLNIAGVKSYEMVQRFSANDKLNALNNTVFDTSYIGITNEEQAIITTTVPSFTSNYPQLWEAYGFRPTYTGAGSTIRTSIPDPTLRGKYVGILASTWLNTIINRVDLFLQQTKLTYKELLELLDCFFLNNWTVVGVSRQFAILNNSSTTNIATCNLNELKIDAASAGDIPPFLHKLHRFVRLARGIGWHYYELDRALRSLGATDIDAATFRAVAQIKKITELLKISVEDACTIWSSVENLPYRDYGKEDDNCEVVDIPSQYIRIFHNPGLSNVSEIENPFPSNASFVPVSIEVFTKFLSGILKLSGAETQYLLEQDVFPAYSSAISGTNITPSMLMLSYIYRQATLMKALKLTSREWLAYKKWIGTDAFFGSLAGATDPVNDVYAPPITTPTAGTNPLNVVRFVTWVNLFKNAGIKTADIEYLLLDKMPDDISDGKANTSIANKLTQLRSELKTKWYPELNTAAEDADQQMKNMLLLIMNEQNADTLIGILKDTLSEALDNQQQLFIENDMAFFLTAADPVADIEARSTVAARYTYVYGYAKTYLIENVLKPTIVATVAKDFSIQEDVAYELLSNVIKIGGSTAFDWLLDAAFVNSTVAIVRWDSNFAEVDTQFNSLLLASKAAWLIGKFGLGLSDVQALWKKDTFGNVLLPNILTIDNLPVRPAKNTNFVPGTTSTGTFRIMRNLLQWMQIRAFAGVDMASLWTALATIDSNINTVVANVFKMPAEDVTALLGNPSLAAPQGILAINPATAYKASLTYLRIIDCLEMQYLLKGSMTTLGQIADGVESASQQVDAAAAIHVVKGMYSDKQWLEVIQPVNDTLRVERRDALIDFLLAFPPTAYLYSWLTSNDIFETMMIDVEMMPVMATTRVLSAMNSVQLWINRLLLGLEVQKLSTGMARQWHTWRKWYRLWEANRKIFLYPENWIEPELRDDKTPLFKELEKFLKQNEVTTENVEEAYATYLERLDQIAHLDIIATHRETTQAYNEYNGDNDDIVHVFGRTKDNPHIYFYRKRMDRVWTPWEKMDVQIDGEHFIPVLWRGRLRLYWLVLTKEQEQEGASSLKSSDQFVLPPAVRWKIQLAFTEYKNGRWTAKQLSKDAVFSRYIYEENPLSYKHAQFYAGTDRDWNRPGDLDKIARESIAIVCNYDGDNLRITPVERNYSVYQQGTGMNGFLNLYEAKPKLSASATEILGIKQLTDLMFGVRDNRPWSVERTDIHALGSFNITFAGISVTPPSTPYTIPECLYLDLPAKGSSRELQRNNYWINYTDYLYRMDPAAGYSHFPDGNVQLLQYAPGANWEDKRVPDGWIYPISEVRERPRNYRLFMNEQKAKSLVFPRQLPQAYLNNTDLPIPYFFYKDYTNSFFVERRSIFEFTTGTLTGGVITGADIGAPAKADGTGGSTLGLSFPGGVPLGGTGGTVLTTSALTSRLTSYRFHNFTHDRVFDFREKLNKDGIDGLLDRAFVNGLVDTMHFGSTYYPTGNVDSVYPDNKVDFSSEGAYSRYNWELFFHIPLLIANKLSQNQQFDEARKWYHYIFDPTNQDSASVDRFWNFPVFFGLASSVPSVEDIMTSGSLPAAVAEWEANPFKPHVVARTRPTAYMKNTVMKYVENLIAWADNLFRTDTRENINEATLLYIMALQILGRRPEKIPARAQPEVQTYATLISSGVLTVFGTAAVKIESLLFASGATGHRHKITVSPVTPTFTPTPVLPRPTSTSFSTIEYYDITSSLTGSVAYFCIPFNDQMLQYWDTIADRLFKIRNSQNIDGVTRELALYDPPIDPAILVKAAASGVSLAGVLGDLTAPLPNYRFSVMSQKATELVQEVKSLGGQLLAALEKKDAESLSLLRSGQEISVLEAVTAIKEQQLAESRAQFEGLQYQLTATTQRRDYYKRLIDNGLIGQEQLQLDSMQLSIPLQISQGLSQTLGGLLHGVPDINIGAFIAGITTGGKHYGDAAIATGTALGVAAGVNNTIGSMAGIKGGFERRKQDWNQQLTLANTEIQQINKQLVAAEIRVAMAENELSNHNLQLNNARMMDEAMRNKYTNEELYDWMSGQISLTYFQAYKLAYDTAKKAERCFRHELGLATSNYIQYGYWDSLKKGLQAGEALAYDLKRLEVAWLDQNKRQFELTKHISLAALNPDALVQLRGAKACTIELPEWIFDMDYPGQYMRRIKSVSISIPCVSGPYTTISCKLSLQSSRYRKEIGGAYPEDVNDERFNYMFGNVQSIATSSGQNDSGMFEFNFRDERYLPFEGCGAISTWRIELPAVYAQFDYNTISDVILHVRYTALDSGNNGMVTGAKENIDTILNADGDNEGLYRIFNLKQEFSSEWNQLVNGAASGLALRNIKNRLPYMVQGRNLAVASIELFFDKNFKATIVTAATPPGGTYPSAAAYNGFFKREDASPEVDFEDTTWYAYFQNVTLADVKNAWMVVHYTVETP